MVRNGADRVVPPRAPVPPILMGARDAAVRSRAERASRLLLRLIALVWMIEGVRQWAGILMEPDTFYLSAVSPLHMAALFFFCVLDFVAAVGLWLVTRWGVAVWLATIIGHAVALCLAPGLMADAVLVGLGDAVLLFGYALCAWASFRERSRA